MAYVGPKVVPVLPFALTERVGVAESEGEDLIGFQMNLFFHLELLTILPFPLISSLLLELAPLWRVWRSAAGWSP